VKQKKESQLEVSPQASAEKQPQINVAVPQTRKGQQELLIENFQELTKKFTELHMKMNSLQQQVKSQKDLQIAIEQTVTKAVKQAMPEMVKK
jgi:hypothetical protein